MFNAAQIHLLVNHIPIFGVLFGLAALLWSLIRPSRDMRWASIGLFVISAIFAWIAAESGDGAAEIVKNIPGVVKALIHNHEEAADLAQISTIILAVLSLIGVAVERFKPALLKSIQILVLILALVTGVLLARTAHLGGLIHHEELRQANGLN